MEFVFACLDAPRHKRQADAATNPYEIETRGTSITINGLDSQTKYTVDVVAETSAGRGTKVATVTVQTGQFSYFTIAISIR